MNISCVTLISITNSDNNQFITNSRTKVEHKLQNLSHIPSQEKGLSYLTQTSQQKVSMWENFHTYRASSRHSKAQCKNIFEVGLGEPILVVRGNQKFYSRYTLRQMLNYWWHLLNTHLIFYSRAGPFYYTASSSLTQLKSVVWGSVLPHCFAVSLDLALHIHPEFSHMHQILEMLLEKTSNVAYLQQIQDSGQGERF